MRRNARNNDRVFGSLCSCSVAPGRMCWAEVVTGLVDLSASVLHWVRDVFAATAETVSCLILISASRRLYAGRPCIRRCECSAQARLQLGSQQLEHERCSGFQNTYTGFEFVRVYLRLHHDECFHARLKVTSIALRSTSCRSMRNVATVTRSAANFDFDATK